jgi:hypothetical protein
LIGLDDEAGPRRGGGAALARERGEAVHEAGEVDGGGLRLEHGVREEEVDGARLERVAGPERRAPGLQQVRGGAEHVARRRCSGRGRLQLASDVGNGDHPRAREVLHVAVGVDDAHAGERGQRAGARRGEGAAHRTNPIRCVGGEGDLGRLDSCKTQQNRRRRKEKEARARLGVDATVIKQKSEQAGKGWKTVFAGNPVRVGECCCRGIRAR